VRQALLIDLHRPFEQTSDEDLCVLALLRAGLNQRSCKLIKHQRGVLIYIFEHVDEVVEAVKDDHWRAVRALHESDEAQGILQCPKNVVELYNLGRLKI